MVGQRAAGKRNFGGWIPADLYEWAHATAEEQGNTHTDILIAALNLLRHHRTSFVPVGAQLEHRDGSKDTTEEKDQ